MSLQIDLEHVTDFEVKCFEHKEGLEPTFENRLIDRSRGTAMKVLPYMLGVSGMWCDYSGITAENVDDIWARLELYQRLFTPPMATIPEDDDARATIPAYFTREDVEAHIGLRINGRDVDFMTWSARMMRTYAKEKGFTADPYEAYDLGPITHSLFVQIADRGNRMTEGFILGALADDRVDLDEIDERIGDLMATVERSLKRQGVTA